MNYQVIEDNPTAQEYCELRVKCGLSPKTYEAATLALPRSLFTVCIRDSEDRLVGMGRIVGDLGCNVQIVDIAVDPSFQKKGLSRLIMDRVMNFIRNEVPPCAFVNLFADVEFLYQKYGFIYSKAKGMMLHRG